MGTPAATEVIGRDGELVQLRDFVRGELRSRALVVTGPAGIGKTTVWEGGVAAAAGNRILTARAGEPESTQPYVVLADLLNGLGPDDLSPSPPPQRRALEIVLLRADAGGEPPDARTIATAVLSVLRWLAAREPVLIAIDDLQWVDAASSDAIAAALRRTASEQIRLLATRRSGPTTPIERALARDAMRVIELDGLTLGAMRRLLADRIGFSASRRIIRRLHEVTLGNPLFALELAGSLARRGTPAIGEELDLPQSLDDLLGARIDASPEARRPLLAAALGGALASDEIVDLVGERDAAEAVARGLLVEVDGRLRPSHPLVAAAAVRRSSARERRELHRGLAERSSDPLRRARHFALATTNVDGELAATVAESAHAAAGRGSLELAVELAEHALRLTPPAAPERDERVLALADFLLQADEGQSLRTLLEAEFDQLAAGTPRARGHLLLADVARSQEEYEAHLESAIREGSMNASVRALGLAAQSLDTSASWLERLDHAERLALEASRIAETAYSRLRAGHAMRWVRVLRGQSFDDLPPGPEGLGGRTLLFTNERLSGLRLAFRGQLDDARRVFERLLAQADDVGQEEARKTFHMHLCEIELRAGDLVTARELLDDAVGDEVRGARTAFQGNFPRLRALAAAISGDVIDAREWAETTRRVTVGQRWDLLEAARAEGMAMLLAGDPGRATTVLRPVWDHLVAEGIDEPGVFPVAPELIEAGLGIGEVGLAEGVLDRLRELANAQDHPWGRATVRRGEGLVAFARDPADPAAISRLVDASGMYAQLDCRFDAARTTLALGRVARRTRRWAVARDSLERAAAGFDALGCAGWAAQARERLAGLPGRRASTGVLTESERRVSELASRGLSNKEIAAALFVGEHTVEVHLAHAYPKLGIRSRAELAHALERSRREA
jgi:DNA-binding CsgD family transcriptional regulator